MISVVGYEAFSFCCARRLPKSVIECSCLTGHCGCIRAGLRHLPIRDREEDVETYVKDDREDLARFMDQSRPAGTTDHVFRRAAEESSATVFPVLVCGLDSHLSELRFCRDKFCQS